MLRRKCTEQTDEIETVRSHAVGCRGLTVKHIGPFGVLLDADRPADHLKAPHGSAQMPQPLHPSTEYTGTFEVKLRESDRDRLRDLVRDLSDVRHFA